MTSCLAFHLFCLLIWDSSVSPSPITLALDLQLYIVPLATTCPYQLTLLPSGTLVTWSKSSAETMSITYNERTPYFKIYWNQKPFTCSRLSTRTVHFTIEWWIYQRPLSWGWSQASTAKQSSYVKNLLWSLTKSLSQTSTPITTKWKQHWNQWTIQLQSWRSVEKWSPVLCHYRRSNPSVQHCSLFLNELWSSKAGKERGES